MYPTPALNARHRAAQDAFGKLLDSQTTDMDAATADYLDAQQRFVDALHDYNAAVVCGVDPKK